MQQKVPSAALKYIFVDLIGDIFYWPLWWYTKGLLNVVLFAWRQIKSENEILAVSIWVKNIFKPMYAQHDIEGRLISFFIRLVQIIARGAVLLLWAVAVLFLVALWIILPIVVVYQILFQLKIINVIADTV